MRAIARRGRASEQGIGIDYITRLNRAYDDWMRRARLAGEVLEIDTDRVPLQGETDAFRRAGRRPQAPLSAPGGAQARGGGSACRRAAARWPWLRRSAAEAGVRIGSRHVGAVGPAALAPRRTTSHHRGHRLAGIRAFDQREGARPAGSRSASAR